MVIIKIIYTLTVVMSKVFTGTDTLLEPQVAISRTAGFFLFFFFLFLDVSTWFQHTCDETIYNLFLCLCEDTVTHREVSVTPCV